MLRNLYPEFNYVEKKVEKGLDGLQIGADLEHVIARDILRGLVVIYSVRTMCCRRQVSYGVQ